MSERTEREIERSRQLDGLARELERDFEGAREASRPVAELCARSPLEAPTPDVIEFLDQLLDLTSAPMRVPTRSTRPAGMRA